MKTIIDGVKKIIVRFGVDSSVIKVNLKAIALLMHDVDNCFKDMFASKASKKLNGPKINEYAFSDAFLAVEKQKGQGKKRTVAVDPDSLKKAKGNRQGDVLNEKTAGVDDEDNEEVDD